MVPPVLHVARDFSDVIGLGKEAVVEETESQVQLNRRRIPPLEAVASTAQTAGAAAAVELDVPWSVADALLALLAFSWPTDGIHWSGRYDRDCSAATPPGEIKSMTSAKLNCRTH